MTTSDEWDIELVPGSVLRHARGSRYLTTRRIGESQLWMTNLASGVTVNGTAETHVERGPAYWEVESGESRIERKPVRRTWKVGTLLQWVSAGGGVSSRHWLKTDTGWKTSVGGGPYEYGPPSGLPSPDMWESKDHGYTIVTGGLE